MVRLRKLPPTRTSASAAPRPSQHSARERGPHQARIMNGLQAGEVATKSRQKAWCSGGSEPMSASVTSTAVVLRCRGGGRCSACDLRRAGVRWGDTAISPGGGRCRIRPYTRGIPELGKRHSNCGKQATAADKQHRRSFRGQQMQSKTSGRRRRKELGVTAADP